MKEGLIRFATYEHKPMMTDIDRVYLRKGLDRWYHRAFVWLGTKLGIYEKGFERSVSYETVEIDMRGSISKMLEHRHNLEMVSGKRAKYLILGRDQMNKVAMQDMVIQHLGVHQVPLMVPVINHRSLPSEPTHRRMMYDLEVIVVPYIDGCFVLPDLDRQ